MERHYNEFADNLDRLARLGFSFSIDRVDRLDLNFVEIAKRNFHYVKVDAADLITLAGSERGEEQSSFSITIFAMVGAICSAKRAKARPEADAFQSGASVTEACP